MESTSNACLPGRHTRFFDHDGEHMLYSVHDGTAKLYRYALKSRDRAEIGLPDLKRDAVVYIAQNPVARQEYAIATAQRSVFVSGKPGPDWKEIARNSQTR